MKKLVVQLAGLLILRGEVVDKGFRIINNQIVPIENTSLIVTTKQTGQTVKTTVKAP